MEKRHNDLLANLLETVHDEGCAHVFRSSLLRWYEKQRLGIRVWRDIEEHWQELTGGEAGSLMKLSGAAGYFLLREDRMVAVGESDEE
jgi:hypothetical protein